MNFVNYFFDLIAGNHVKIIVNDGERMILLVNSLSRWNFKWMEFIKEKKQKENIEKRLSDCIENITFTNAFWMDARSWNDNYEFEINFIINKKEYVVEGLFTGDKKDMKFLYKTNLSEKQEQYILSLFLEFKINEMISEVDPDPDEVNQNKLRRKWDRKLLDYLKENRFGYFNEKIQNYRFAYTELDEDEGYFYLDLKNRENEKENISIWTEDSEVHIHADSEEFTQLELGRLKKILLEMDFKEFIFEMEAP